jgi:hypothetical protein
MGIIDWRKGKPMQFLELILMSTLVAEEGIKGANDILYLY